MTTVHQSYKNIVDAAMSCMSKFISFMSRSTSGNARRLLTAGGVFVLSATILVSSTAKAQEGEDKPAAPAASSNVPVKKDGKRTSINFEDQLIEGQAAKPELFYLLQQRNNNFKRLIRLRENFLPEMRKSSEDAARSPNATKGSGN